MMPISAEQNAKLVKKVEEFMFMRRFKLLKSVFRVLFPDLLSDFRSFRKIENSKFFNLCGESDQLIVHFSLA